MAKETTRDPAANVASSAADRAAHLAKRGGQTAAGDSASRISCNTASFHHVTSAPLPPPPRPAADLHTHELLHIFSFLAGEDLARVSCCSKGLLQLLTTNACIWRDLQRREHAPVARILAAEAACPPPQATQAGAESSQAAAARLLSPELLASCGITAYRRGRDLSLLRSVRWAQTALEPSRLAASPREGSACAVVCGSVGLLIGGWTTFGIQADVRALRLDPSGRPTWVPARVRCYLPLCPPR